MYVGLAFQNLLLNVLHSVFILQLKEDLEELEEVELQDGRNPGPRVAIEEITG
jgi:hypothetical protein